MQSSSCLQVVRLNSLDDIYLCTLWAPNSYREPFIFFFGLINLKTLVPYLKKFIDFERFTKTLITKVPNLFSTDLIPPINDIYIYIYINDKHQDLIDFERHIQNILTHQK